MGTQKAVQLAKNSNRQANRKTRSQNRKQIRDSIAMTVSEGIKKAKSREQQERRKAAQQTARRQRGRHVQAASREGRPAKPAQCAASAPAEALLVLILFHNNRAIFTPPSASTGTERSFTNNRAIFFQVWRGHVCGGQRGWGGRGLCVAGSQGQGQPGAGAGQGQPGAEVGAGRGAR